MNAQAGANTPGWLHRPATQFGQASTDVLEKKMTAITPEHMTAYVYLDTCSGQRFVTSEKITRRTLHEFLGEVAIDPSAIRNPQPDLPTDPGRYVDRDGDDDWLLHEDGRWFHKGSVVFGTRMYAVAPFTRLVRERSKVTRDQIVTALIEHENYSTGAQADAIVALVDGGHQ